MYSDWIVVLMIVAHIWDTFLNCKLWIGHQLRSSKANALSTIEAECMAFSETS